MRNFHFVVLVMVLMTACAGAQNDPTLACTIESLRPGNPAGPRDNPLDELKAGQPCAIAAAGNSKDSQYIPYLKKVEKSDHTHSGQWYGHPAEVAQMALAKLGVEQDLFEIECETQPNASKYARVFAIRDKLPYVGGWFAIRLSMDMLPNNGQNREYLFYGDDLRRDWYPQKFAIDTLPYLIGPSLNSEPLDRFGVAKSGSEQLKGLTEEQVIDGWYHWVLDHENELKKLDPTGESVHFSQARCEKYLKEQGALISKSRRR
jgi:hypothetical protein